MAKRGRPFGSGLFFKDPIDHQRHLSFLKSRSQAAHRKEPWSLTIEEYFLLWPREIWPLRGRKSTDLCMVRRDIEKPWRLENCVIIPRYQQLVRGRKPRRPIQGEVKL